MKIHCDFYGWNNLGFSFAWNVQIKEVKRNTPPGYCYAFQLSGNNRSSVLKKYISCNGNKSEPPWSQKLRNRVLFMNKCEPSAGAIHWNASVFSTIKVKFSNNANGTTNPQINTMCTVPLPIFFFHDSFSSFIFDCLKWWQIWPLKLWIIFSPPLNLPSKYLLRSPWFFYRYDHILVSFSTSGARKIFFLLNLISWSILQSAHIKCYTVSIAVETTEV